MIEALHICNPCREGAHLECVSSPQMSCQCIICEGNRIGDEVVGEPGEPKHGRLRDRFDPQSWRP